MASHRLLPSRAFRLQSHGRCFPCRILGQSHQPPSSSAAGGDGLRIWTRRYHGIPGNRDVSFPRHNRDHSPVRTLSSYAEDYYDAYATDDAHHDVDDPQAMSVRELKEKLQHVGVSTSNFIEKRELVDALVEARREREHYVMDDDNEDVWARNEEEWKSFTVPQLKEFCRERGLKVGGRKDELITRLAMDVNPADLTVDSDEEVDSGEEEKSSALADQEEPTPEEPVEYCFDRANNYNLVRTSDLKGSDRIEDAVLSPIVHIANEADSLLKLLPPSFAVELEQHKAHLIEVVLDVGRRPYAWLANSTAPDASTHSDKEQDDGTNSQPDDKAKQHVNHNIRMYLGQPDTTVSPELLNDIVHDLHFGKDNRAGINGTLHRISAIRNRDGDVIGLTMRVGRHVPGNAIMIADLLYRTDLSVLFVGAPGTGKTSIIRDAASVLAERNNVVIVDTSCEIGGAGNIPHECIGNSRRMQVESVDVQASVMIECVQNHTPHVMVIDEIGRESEVKAALTCNERGVRIVASAHGNMAGLVRNAQLCDLVGGVDVVTIGDRTAKKEAKAYGQKQAGNKLRAERRGPPIFDVVIELKRGKLHEWEIVYPTGAAVDSILSRGSYTAQVRSRGESDAGHLRITEVRRSANRDDIVEESKSRETTFAQNKVPETRERVHDNIGTHCPSCFKDFSSRFDMVQHALSKKSCRKKLTEETYWIMEDIRAQGPHAR